MRPCIRDALEAILTSTSDGVTSIDIADLEESDIDEFMRILEQLYISCRTRVIDDRLKCVLTVTSNLRGAVSSMLGREEDGDSYDAIPDTEAGEISAETKYILRTLMETHIANFPLEMNFVNHGANCIEELQKVLNDYDIAFIKTNVPYKYRIANVTVDKLMLIRRFVRSGIYKTEKRQSMRDKLRSKTGAVLDNLLLKNSTKVRIFTEFIDARLEASAGVEDTNGAYQHSIGVDDIVEHYGTVASQPLSSNYMIALVLHHYRREGLMVEVEKEANSRKRLCFRWD